MDRVGMSLRDWFAGQAMNGLVRSGDGVNYSKAISKAAYAIADAMMEARKEQDNTDAWKVKRDKFQAVFNWARANGLDNVRACKSLARAGIDSLDKINYEALREIKNCGAITRSDILLWKARKEAKQ